MKGKVLKLPEGYTGMCFISNHNTSEYLSIAGVVAKSTERTLPQPSRKEDTTTADNDSDSDCLIIEDEPEPEPVKILESTASFDEVVVWGHDQPPGNDDAFVKGVEEWLAFANAIHRPGV